MPGIVAVQPFVDVEQVDLLGPEHSGERLTLHRAFIRRRPRRVNRCIELIGFGSAAREDLLDVGQRIVEPVGRQPEAPHDGAVRRHAGLVVQTRLGPGLRWVHARLAVDDVPVKRVFGVGPADFARWDGDALHVGLVVREEGLAARRTVQPALAKAVGKREIRQWIRRAIVGEQRDGSLGRVHRDRRLRAADRAPGPGVPKPQVRQDVQDRRFGPPVECFDADHDVVRRVLRVFDEDVEVAVAVECAGVEQLEFHSPPLARAVFVDQALIGEFGLRILVEHPHVAVRRRIVQVEVVLLDVLAVIAFPGRQPEVPLLQDWIASIPEGRGENEQLIAITQPADGVLSPPVGLGPRHIVGEVGPGVAISAVVFADRTPGPVAHEAAPAAPQGHSVVSPVRQAAMFCRIG